MLELQLLGPPVMTVDGEAVVVDTRKATALLAYLGVSGQPHRRDALATLLWPDADASRAAGALRRTLSTVRTAVGADAVHADRSSVGLAMDAVTSDIANVEQLLADCASHGHPPESTCAECIAPLQAVAALHRGRFLEGFALRDSAAYDDWQFFTAEELDRRLAGVLERLSSALVTAGRISDAIGVGRRRLALDPLHEPAHRDLMRLYAWNGDQGAALSQYRECVRTLDRELGVGPLPETTAVYEDVLEQRLEPPPTAATPAPLAPAPLPARPAGHAPFVGRDEAMATVISAVEGIAEDGVLVVVEGEAGIGKTRLVEEVLAARAMAGRRRVTARCYEGETGLAYGVMVEALRFAHQHRGDQWVDALPQHVATEVARLLPEIISQRGDVSTPPSLDGPGARSRFVDAVGRALSLAVDDEAPGLIVLEDLHWIDDASLEAVSHLVRRLRGRPLAVVVTWRSEQIGRGHPLRRLAADAQRDGRLTAVTLERLGAEAVADALDGFGITDPEAAQRVATETEGLPLLVVEFARAVAEDEAALEGPLPGGAREVLLGRLDGVSDAAGQVLVTAAVIGRSFELDVLSDASGRTDEEVAAAIEELLSRRLVEEVSDAGGDPHHVTYDFTHAQLRRLAYDTAALARRRLLHRRVATALETRGRRLGGDALAGVVAGHWAAAGEDTAAATWEVRAGAYAAALLAVPEAITHYSNALALGHTDVAGIHERLGDLWTLQGRYAEAAASYESAAASAAPGAAARLEHKLGVVHHRAGRWDMAERHFERALQILGDGGQASLLSRITADRGLNAFRSGDVDRATALAEAAAAAAADGADSAGQAQAANLLGLIARTRGDLDAARRHLEHSLSLAGEMGDAAAETSALNNLALAVGASGDVEQALQLADAALQRSAAVGDRHREAALHNNIADLLRARGDAEQAMEHLKQAVAIFAEVGEPGVLSPEVWKLVDW
ncbi:MAG TPA: AAA family ATPase [Egibacteraceae bacterium]|nr:AAA family ATPase [Egibacteraceae bacterium]